VWECVSWWVCEFVGAARERAGAAMEGAGRAAGARGVPSILSPILPISRIVHKNGRDNPVCYCYVNRFHLLSPPMWR
jgi:hypothetical protein